MLDIDAFVAAVESLAGYCFNDKSLLQRALTHRSFGADHNERLEFLGDAVLGLIIGEALYHKFPDAHEGQLSHLRMSLVKGDTLSEVAARLELGQYLILGVGERRTGGTQRRSILEDSLEALIGAIYLDSGLDTTRTIVLPWFAERLASVTLQDNVRDAKSRLQELLQARQLELPQYDIAHIEGAEHDQTFTVTCSIVELKLTVQAQGKSRKRAEQAAAKKAMSEVELLFKGETDV